MKNTMIITIIAGLLIIWLYGSWTKPEPIEAAVTEKTEMADISSKLSSSHLPDNPNLTLDFDTNNLESIYLAGGCFWGLEAYLTRIPGVYDATSGYANGRTQNPSYEDLIYNNSGHAETVHVTYDPKIVSLETILDYYFNVVDPTSLNKQGNDRGVQYRSGVYFENEEDETIIINRIEKEQMLYDDQIVVEVKPLEHYYLAETYHQDYLEKNPNGYCHIDINSVEDHVSEYTRPSDTEIKEMLTKLQYKVTQQNGTEKAFQNEYWNNKEAGIYVDIVTGEPLFTSIDKYQSGTGWPSFVKPINESVILELEDKKWGMVRTEVKSKLGDTHLGHVFTDGPSDRGGLRYCVNSAALKFVSVDELENMGYGHLKYLFE